MSIDTDPNGHLDHHERMVEVVLEGLEQAYAAQLRAMLASVTLDVCFGIDPQLAAHLREIARGGDPVIATLARGREATFAGIGEHDWYDGGIQETCGRLARNTAALVTRSRDELLAICRTAVGEAASIAAHHAWWNHAHATGYCFDHDEVAGRIAREVTERFERRWHQLVERRVIAI